MKKICYMIFVVSLFSCRQNQPLQTVSKVDLNKYAGVWYEIAAFPQSFEKGCSCTTAEYILTDKNFVRVINTCKRNGDTTTAKGKAFIEKGSNNAKLKVQFFWPFRGKYWIIYLEDDYSIAVVGHPNRQYLWILARDKKIPESKYDSLIEYCKKNGFDMTRLVKTDQPCN